MSSDPKWWEKRAEALAEGDTWPRTKTTTEEEEIEEEEIEEKLETPNN